MSGARWKSLPKLAATVMITSVVSTATVILPAVPAFADTVGSAPNLQLACGAMRDVPSEWHVVQNAGHCPGWGYSWTFTSPSNNHFATWGFSVLDPGTLPVTLQVEAWIPSKFAGQHTAYYYQLCGSSQWVYIGQLFQEADTGWYTPGSISLPPRQELCAIREQNTGGGSFDMAEDALGVSQ